MEEESLGKRPPTNWGTMSAQEKIEWIEENVEGGEL